MSLAIEFDPLKPKVHFKPTDLDLMSSSAIFNEKFSFQLTMTKNNSEITSFKEKSISISVSIQDSEATIEAGSIDLDMSKYCSGKPAKEEQFDVLLLDKSIDPDARIHFSVSSQVAEETSREKNTGESKKEQSQHQEEKKQSFEGEKKKGAKQIEIKSKLFEVDKKLPSSQMKSPNSAQAAHFSMKSHQVPLKSPAKPVIAQKTPQINKPSFSNRAGAEPAHQTGNAGKTNFKITSPQPKTEPIKKISAEKKFTSGRSQSPELHANGSSSFKGRMSKSGLRSSSSDALEQSLIANETQGKEERVEPGLVINNQNIGINEVQLSSNENKDKEPLSEKVSEAIMGSLEKKEETEASKITQSKETHLEENKMTNLFERNGQIPKKVEHSTPTKEKPGNMRAQRGGAPFESKTRQAGLKIDASKMEIEKLENELLRVEEKAFSDKKEFQKDQEKAQKRIDKLEKEVSSLKRQLEEKEETLAQKERQFSQAFNRLNQEKETLVQDRKVFEVFHSISQNKF